MNNYKIVWKNNSIAKIRKGKNYLSPEIDIIADEALDLKKQRRFNFFLNKWLGNYIGKVK